MSKKEELIIDDGKIRPCPHNYAIIGYWGVRWKFFSYKKSLEEYDIQELTEAIKLLCSCLIYTVLFPIVPFLHCFFTWRRACTDVAEEKQKGLK